MIPEEAFYWEVIRQEQARADREGARVRKDWALASLGVAVFGFCVGLMVAGWHP